MEDKRTEKEIEENLQQQIDALQAHMEEMTIEELRLALITTVTGFGKILGRLAAAHRDVVSMCDNMGNMLDDGKLEDIPTKLVERMLALLTGIAKTIDVQTMVDEPRFLSELEDL